MTMTSDEQSPDWTRVADAASELARPALAAMVANVIKAMRDMDAAGLFDEVLARHVWDEYCWQLQEGPFDEDDIGFGSTSGNFDEILITWIEDEIDKHPPAMQLCMNIHIQGGELDDEEFELLSKQAIVDWVKERVNEAASARDLGLMGHDRADEIMSYIEPSGIVAKVLEESGEFSELLGPYADDLLLPASDGEELANLADSLLDAFCARLEQEGEEGGSTVLAALAENEAFKNWLLEHDIRPLVDDMVAQLQESLDG